MKLPPLRNALLLLAIVAAAQCAAADEMRVAVSIRYLLIKGVSHAHIFLYSGEAKMLRQLTNDATAQDLDPVFSPDGGEIAFTRKQKAGDEMWLVASSGGDAHRIDSPPAWYASASQEAPYFTLFTAEEERQSRDAENSTPPASATPTPSATPKPKTLTAPDGSDELILERTGNDEIDYDHENLGKLYRYRDLKTGKETKLGDWPGFETIWNPMRLHGEDESYFLIEPPLRVVFFYKHLNSTDGDTTCAVDLKAKRIVRLSPNGAAPFPIPHDPSFLVLSEERYVPLGDGKRTVNCSYLDRRDAELRKTRFARQAPAIFGGASVFRPGMPPLTIRSEPFQ